MKTGRPTDYNENVLTQIEQYIKSCGREQTELPTLEGLAIYIGVATDTIQEWKKVHPEFSASVKGILERQKNQLMNDGLYGGKEVNSTMAIFLLKANHGLIEKSALDLTTDGEKLEGLVIVKDASKSQ